MCVLCVCVSVCLGSLACKLLGATDHKLTPRWSVTCNRPTEDVKGWSLMFHDEVALQCSYSPVSIVCWEQNNLKICTYKRAANFKKSLYPAGVAFSVFIVEHFYQYRSSQTTNSQNILSSQLTFLSNPPFVHSSAPAQLTLTRCPLRIVSTGNLLFLFYAYSSKHNKYVIVSLCSSKSKAVESLWNQMNIFRRMPWKIGAGLRWIVCLI